MTTAIDPFVHEALFYRDADSYLAGTVPFIRGGLDAGEPVLVAAPQANVDLLRGELDGAADRVRFLDMTRAGRNPGRIIPGVLRAFVDRHAPTHARIIGEPIWPDRSVTEYPACVQHEALINTAFAGRTATILCPYDAVGLDAGVLADAERTHPVLVDGGTRTASRAYQGARPVVEAYNRPLPEPEQAVADHVFTEPADLAAVRRLVAYYADRAGLEPERAGDLQVAVNELCTNTLIHSAGPGSLRIWQDGTTLVCEVRDGGQLRDPMAGRVPVAVDATAGRGLLMVNYVCDLVRVHTGTAGTTIRAYMAL
jgi:anti-sigma regulatory factor (Ser/Thr protein kinase)